MLFKETALQGAFIIEMEMIQDDRGWFARSFCQDEFQEHNLNPCVAQCNISFNAKTGTLRGMHYQMAPHAEAKLIRCTRGALYDVILDLRPDSLTFKQWMAVELSENSPQMLYIPEGMAHGFQTLTDNTEVFYQMSAFYHAEAARGVRWDDPAFHITWPAHHKRIISAKDQSYPDFVT
jgi:dTDP-4-dehydrorhamnose 3,5-epimerase